VIEMLSAKPPWKEVCASPVAAMLHIAASKAPPPLPVGLQHGTIDFILLCLQRIVDQRASCASLLRHPFITTRSAELSPVATEPFSQVVRPSSGPGGEGDVGSYQVGGAVDAVGAAGLGRGASNAPGDAVRTRPIDAGQVFRRHPGLALRSALFPPPPPQAQVHHGHEMWPHFREQYLPISEEMRL